MPMTMEDLEGSTSSGQPSVMPPTDVIMLKESEQAIKNSVPWDEESSAKFVCHLCKKTFYNVIALQNHKNTQHDLNDSSSDEELNSNYTVKREQNVNGLCGFKFIPLINPGETDQPYHNGLMNRNFTEDTSYLIVKVEGEESEMDTMKKSRYEGTIRRNQLKTDKQPVDLRGPFTCTFPSSLRPDLQCRKIFFNCCDYSMHYREEHTKRRKAALRCQVCEKRLNRDKYPNNEMSAQFRTSTTNPFPYFCRMCGETFLKSTVYEEHNRNVHAKLKPHQCSLCFKRFTQQGGLQQHMRMHTGIRPFACTFCAKTFTQKAGLDQHLRTHTKVKPFKCVVCNKCFSQSVHLRQHMRTHTNIQPFECTLCGRRFKQSSHLNFHMRSHLGDASALVVERYAQVVRQQQEMEFLNLANLQPVQDGDTMYYAAELAPGPPTGQNAFNYQTQIIIPENY